jgi:hypothetical protein
MRVKTFASFINEDWGSSDQSAMNKSIHKDLGNPKTFPGLDKMLSAAEDAVDFYWDEWPEYKKDREELINKAGRTYMRAYFPDLFKGFTMMFSESIESDEAFESLLILAEAWRLEPEAKDDMRISDIVKKSAGNENKEISLAQQMAKSIKDGDKAIRRARAAFEKGLEHIAKPFFLKAKDLGYDYHLSDAELKMVESLNEASEEEMVKKEAISRLADFFRVSHGALSKFKFDGNDNVKELTKALNSTSDQGTELYYKMAIKLAKKEVGVEESEEAIKALEEAMVQVAGKNKPSGAQVLAMVIVDHLIERDFFKPGIEKMKKQVIVDIQKVIMDSTF